MATAQHVVVDGSNIATEGRSIPSLAQLEEAIAELRLELPNAEVTVVVDATFAHRIDASEQPRFEEESLKGAYVSPPAGAIGRGDAFLLRIAEKVNGMVLSNDSFQEFHGEHPWLFDLGRLLGAMPVKGVGWIFVPRTPVRGPKSRVAVRDAGRAKQRVEKAIAEATKEVVEPETRPATAAERRSRHHPAVQPQAVNDPMTFISFIAEHPLGKEIDAEVDSFSSHGAVVLYGDVRCYVPLSGLGDPPPKSAREVLKKGEKTRFVISALDPYRRGIELALPGVGTISGKPSEETVAAEVRMARRPRAAAASVAPSEPSELAAGESPPAPMSAPSRRRAPKTPAPAVATTDATPPATASRRGRSNARATAEVADPKSGGAEQPPGLGATPRTRSKPATRPAKPSPAATDLSDDAPESPSEGVQPSEPAISTPVRPLRGAGRPAAAGTTPGRVVKSPAAKKAATPAKSAAAKKAAAPAKPSGTRKTTGTRSVAGAALADGAKKAPAKVAAAKVAAGSVRRKPVVSNP